MTNLKRLVLALTMMLGGLAQAESTNEESSLKAFITHGGCRVYTDRNDLDRETPGDQTFEIWLFLSILGPTSYNPEADLRGEMLLEDNVQSRVICTRLNTARKEKKPLTFVIDVKRSLGNGGRILRIKKVLPEVDANHLEVIENFSVGPQRLWGFSEKVKDASRDVRVREIILSNNVYGQANELTFANVEFFAGLSPNRLTNADGEWVRAKAICRLLGFAEAKTYSAEIKNQFYVGGVHQRLVKVIDINKVSTTGSILEASDYYDTMAQHVRVFTSLTCRR